MNTLIEILNPSFLLRDALYHSLVIGIVCPLIGVYLVLRRMIFLGVALPQVSASGIAFSFLVYAFLHSGHKHGESSELLLALSGSVGFTLIVLLVLSALEGKGNYSMESRIGATYAFAASLTYLFLAADPHGEAQMVNILKGDMLAATQESLLVLVVAYFLIAFFIIKFRKQLLLVSFDRELAKVFRMRVSYWDATLFLAIGIVIGIGVMSAGPLVIFGFLVIPPLVAITVTKRMATFSLVSSIIGGLSAFIGFYLAYSFDLPLGPAEVAFVSGVLILTSLTRWVLAVWRESGRL